MAMLIDLEKIKPIDFPSTEMDGLDVIRYLNTLPTVDAVEVVRCRECKYHEDTSVTEYEHCCLLSKTVRYNDFCSYGERKDGDVNG